VLGCVEQPQRYPDHDNAIYRDRATYNGAGQVGPGRGLIGTITAENGSTWTVNARNGTAYTVTITPQTQFGSRRTPGTAQQFPVGSTVRVSGATNGNTVTASRITVARPANSTSTPPSSPPS
jgi:hypothetical protein